MLRVRKLAKSVTSQVMLPPLQSASVAPMPSVSVASFTFCRPFAHAEEHTSHRKTRIAVKTKSWERTGQERARLGGPPPADPSEQRRWDQYSRKWVQSQSPCRRACSLDKPAGPPCCTGSRRWRCPRRTRRRTRSPRPGAWSWRSGCRWCCFHQRAGTGSTWQDGGGLTWLSTVGFSYPSATWRILTWTGSGSWPWAFRCCRRRRTRTRGSSPRSRRSFQKQIWPWAVWTRESRDEGGEDGGEERENTVQLWGGENIRKSENMRYWRF